MKYVLDAHTLIWAQDRPEQLGERALFILQDLNNQLFLSVGTIWEISIKVSIGKLKLSMPFQQWIQRSILDLELSLLDITIEHTVCQMSLEWHHKDPFDRLLIAQALVEDMVLLSSDIIFDQYSNCRTW
ncbi:type II toxin-antitoxin system VapC family toxin [Gloeomargarita lithophora]|uniref:type II toxin-antitoxin system VapC family toxin n=1 Tax=Gloeomargarita lithophora TaxID=1188228 RepID=UPI003F70FEBC